VTLLVIWPRPKHSNGRAMIDCTSQAYPAARSLAIARPRGAQFEFTLAAVAQNLRRLAKLVARPPPLPGPMLA
jgi:hypothetical protein